MADDRVGGMCGCHGWDGPSHGAGARCAQAMRRAAAARGRELGLQIYTPPTARRPSRWRPVSTSLPRRHGERYCAALGHPDRLIDIGPLSDFPGVTRALRRALGTSSVPGMICRVRKPAFHGCRTWSSSRTKSGGFCRPASYCCPTCCGTHEPTFFSRQRSSLSIEGRSRDRSDLATVDQRDRPAHRGQPKYARHQAGGPFFGDSHQRASHPPLHGGASGNALVCGSLRVGLEQHLDCGRARLALP